MNRTPCYGRLLGLVGAFFTLLMPVTTRAQLTVDPVTTFGGGLYHYNYTITNSTTDDVAIVSLNVMPGTGVIQNLGGPSGFLEDFDSRLGIVDFIGNTDLFTAGSARNGFVFDSPLPPSSSAFTALTVTGALRTGPTLAPLAVPEPTGMALLGALIVSGSLALTCRSRRREPSTIIYTDEETKQCML